MGKKFKENKVIENISKRNIFGHMSFVYKIRLKQSSVFMRIDETPYYNERRYIAIVDASKFYREWTGKSVDQCMIADDWE